MADTVEFREIKLRCLEHLIRPLVRYCMRNSHSYQDYARVGKQIFIQAAEKELRKTSKKVNVSRLSALTGINRAEVTKHYKESEPGAGQRLSVLWRVLGQWEQDERFSTKRREPRVLSYKGQDSEFHQLVKTISKDMNPGTVLYELERSNLVQKTPKGVKRVRQLADQGEDLEKLFELVSKDVDMCINAAEVNAAREVKISNLYVRTEYDNVFDKDLEKIRSWFVNEGKAFHRRARDFLSKYDQDVHPEPGEKAGRKVALSAVSFVYPDE